MSSIELALVFRLWTLLSFLFLSFGSCTGFRERLLRKSRGLRKVFCVVRVNARDEFIVSASWRREKGATAC